MADSAAFDYVCAELERLSSFDALVARGTVRLALKEGGLDPRTVSPAEMAVVLKTLMPRELASRGMADGEALLERIGAGLAGVARGAAPETPEAIFQRLGAR